MVTFLYRFVPICSLLLVAVLLWDMYERSKLDRKTQSLYEEYDFLYPPFYDVTLRRDITGVMIDSNMQLKVVYLPCMFKGCQLEIEHHYKQFGGITKYVILKS